MDVLALGDILPFGLRSDVIRILNGQILKERDLDLTQEQITQLSGILSRDYCSTMRICFTAMRRREGFVLPSLLRVGAYIRERTAPDTAADC